MTDPPAPPGNLRIEVLTFDPDAGTMHVTLRGVDGVRDVGPASVAALFGARIRHDSVTPVVGKGGISFGKLAVTMATGIPVGITKGGSKEKAVVGQELVHALALRVTGIADVWYLLAASFNFRKALGPDATYATDMNLRAFVKRLAAFAPSAKRDPYVSAIVEGGQLPPPLESLLEFLRIAAA